MGLKALIRQAALFLRKWLNGRLNGRLNGQPRRFLSTVTAMNKVSRFRGKRLARGMMASTGQDYLRVIFRQICHSQKRRRASHDTPAGRRLC
jgi:hypothetical protein